MSLNSRDRLHAAARAQRHRLRTLVDAAARDLDVLSLQRARHVGHGQVVGPQAIGIQPHVDLALAPAEHGHLADAGDAFDLPAQDLVRVLGHFADRPVGGQREAEDRRRVRIEPVDARLLDGFGQEGQCAVDLVTHFLRGDVGILVQQEADRDDGDTFRRGRSQLVDAADRIHRFFDLVGDFRLDLFGRGARLDRRDDNGGDVHLGEAVDAEQREGEHADDRERKNQHRREDGAFNGERSKPLHD